MRVGWVAGQALVACSLRETVRGSASGRTSSLRLGTWFVIGLADDGPRDTSRVFPISTLEECSRALRAHDGRARDDRWRHAILHEELGDAHLQGVDDGHVGQRGCKVVAVTGVQQSLAGEPDPAVGGRLLDEADIVIDLCTHEADAMVLVPGLDTPVGPGSTLAYVAIVNSLKVRIAQLLVERGVTPPVITRASVVGAERSRALFESAYREHARRVARTIVREPDDEPDSQA